MELAAFDWSGSYCGPAPLPAAVWQQWNFDAMLIVALLAAAAFAGVKLDGRRRGAALLGIAVLALAFISPLCALTVALFSARIVHHLILVALAAPLLVFAMSARARTLMAQALLPLLALQTVVFWFWHIPDAYAAALGNVGIYWLMQLTLLTSAVLFWAAVIGSPSLAKRLMVLLTSIIQMGLLGALLVFADTPLYSPHATAPLAFGLSALTDQQLAGLIMWVPAGIPYLAAGLCFVALWLSAPTARPVH